MKRKRILVLPISAVIITALVIYGETRTPREQTGAATAVTMNRPAPRFVLWDQESHIVKFERYLGRHQILVVFFDGQAGADRDPIFSRLRKHYATLEAAGTVVIGISTALPQHNRQAIERSGEFPFPLLSDPDLSVHRQWGRLDEQTGEPLSGVFLVDRTGQVAWSNDVYQPLENPERVIQQMLEES